MVGHGVEQCGTVFAGQLFGFVLQRGGLHGGGVGQQEIAVPAAAVNDVGPGQAAAVQQLVHVVLHEQF